MNLTLYDTIHVSTMEGMKKIQLCLGDITTLPMHKKVDILMVSAFPGTYQPSPYTLIGALHRTFSLDVNQLASNKAEDLRDHFHCWVSEPLPEKVPYRRLLCFEQSTTSQASRHDGKAALVGYIFRALFTLWTEQKGFSVITPLLGTGSQNLDKTLVMKNMVSSCVTWMRAGLPLTRLILVIYKNKAEDRFSDEDKSAIDEFRRLKVRTEKDIPSQTLPSIEYDAFVVYSEADEALMQAFLNTLHEISDKQWRILTRPLSALSSDCRIPTMSFPKSRKSEALTDWKVTQAIPSVATLRMSSINAANGTAPGESEEEILEREPDKSSRRRVLKRSDTVLTTGVEDDVKQIMMKSKQVLIGLSTHLLTCTRGPEFYNMARCLNILCNRRLLVPLYLSSIENLPTYMSLYQWIDISNESLIASAASKVSLIMREELPTMAPIFTRCESIETGGNIIMADGQRSPAIRNTWTLGNISMRYDLFISYSHKDAAAAHLFLEAIRRRHPFLRIFFDEDTIKTGYSWQSTVYNALCNSHVCLALLSPNYFQSVVCCEELALAMTQHLCGHRSILIPLSICPASSIKDNNMNLPLLTHVKSIAGALPILQVTDIVTQYNWTQYHWYASLANYIADTLTSFDPSQLIQEPLFSCLHMPSNWSLHLILSKARQQFYQELCRSSYQPQSLDANISPYVDSHSFICFSPFSLINSRESRMAIVYHEEDRVAANFMKKVLEAKWKQSVRIQCFDCTQSHLPPGALDCMSSVIILLSPAFSTTSTCLDILQICLSLQRTRGPQSNSEHIGFHICPIMLSALPTRPLYLQLIPCRFSATDTSVIATAEMWVRDYYCPKYIQRYLCGDAVAFSKPGPLQLTTIVVLYYAVEWLLSRTEYGRLRYVEDYLPVLLSIQDYRQRGFAFPESVRCKSSDFHQFEIPTENLVKHNEAVADCACASFAFSESHSSVTVQSQQHELHLEEQMVDMCSNVCVPSELHINTSLVTESATNGKSSQHVTSKTHKPSTMRKLPKLEETEIIKSFTHQLMSSS